MDILEELDAGLKDGTSSLHIGITQIRTTFLGSGKVLQLLNLYSLKVHDKSETLLCLQVKVLQQFYRRLFYNGGL